MARFQATAWAALDEHRVQQTGPCRTPQAALKDAGTLELNAWIHLSFRTDARSAASTEAIPRDKLPKTKPAGAEAAVPANRSM